jgi:quinol monooxygenase YgiN
MATQDKSLSIAPYFKIHSGKKQEVKALCERFVEKTKTEPGCLYYGFSFSGDVLFCREAYLDGDSALAHLQNVGPLLAEMGKVTDLLRLEFHGPEAELDKLRGPAAELRPEYFTLEYGFRR